MSVPSKVIHSVFSTKDHASLYKRYRQCLPQVVLDYILGHLKSGISPENWNIAVDVGCGGGQSAQVMAKHFKQVYGFDVSEAQIKEAIDSEHPSNVHFEVSKAESLPSIKSNSVQLMTASSAVHWFNLNEFFPEAKRVLAPNGVLAFIAYVMFEPYDPANPSDTRLTDLMLSLRRDPSITPYRLSNMDSADHRYKDIAFPDYFEYFYKDDIMHKIELNGNDIIGFIQTWSPFQQMLKTDDLKAKQFLSDFEDKVKNILKTNDLKEKQLSANYRYFVALGRKRASEV